MKPSPKISSRGCDTLDITVVVCTYNRCRDLARALESIAASQLASSVTWEVLVVDNRSTDETRLVVEGLCRRYPGRFRYHFEPAQGLSYARNAGIANSRGEVLVFTDDDVVVQPTWLQNLTAASCDPSWAGAGGKILPAQKFTPPPWLSDDISEWGAILCAHFDLGDSAHELVGPPYGANMAFRKSVFEKYGGFRTDLGRNPGDNIGNEDTEFGRRLIAAGERLKYEPAAIVYHRVIQERLTQEYFFSSWFDYGRAMIKERGDCPDVYGIPRDYLALIGRAAEISFMSLRWMCAIGPRKKFRHKCRVWKSIGQFAEIRRRAIDRKSSKTPSRTDTIRGSSHF